MTYNTLREVEVDLHYLTRESARRRVIDTIADCHSRNIPYVKFITGRGNHINSTGE
jgi:DNA-nicking Smr family endonuclease